MRRGCLFGCGGVIILALAACLLLYFVGLPRIQDRIADDFEEGVATVVADGLVNAAPGSGTLVITEDQLNTKLNEDVENSDVTAEITPSGISIQLETEEGGNRDVGYSAVPTVVDGQLVLADVESSDSWMERFLPKGKLAGAVEDGVNNVLAERNLQLDGIDLGDGEMTLTTVPAQ